MNTVTDLFSSSWIQALGWTLLHSLWQSFLCSIIVTVVLRYVPSRLSNVRYAIATGGLLLIFLVSVGTFLHLNSAAFSITYETEKDLHQTISISTAQHVYQSFNGLLTEVKSSIQSNIPFIVSIWGIGALLFSVRIFSGWRYIKKLRENAIPFENEWSQRVQQLATQLSINQIITLAESSLIQAPIVIGYIKPMILIPVGMCSGLSAEQLESIFIHELIHIRRGDYFVNMIQSFLEALFFFNPFVWIVSGLIRRERENCCDDAVVKVHGNALAYAHALATLEEVRLSKTGLALSLAENKNQLLNRIKRIMEKSVNSYSGRERMVPLVLLIVGLICASWLTIQSGKSENDLASNVLNEQTVGSDTAIKEKSARYYRKKVTAVGEDGNPTDEIVEEFEGDEELRQSMLDLSLEISPIPPVDVDIDIPSIAIRDLVDMNMNIEIAIPPVDAIPYLNLPFPAQFNMDTIPLPKHWEDRDWEEFGKEFEKNFREKFGDFYENHEAELKKIMEEIEEKFSHQNNEAWEAEIAEFADQQAQLAEMQEEGLRQSNFALAEYEKQAKKIEHEMKSWEENHAMQLKEMEADIKAMEKTMRINERDLKEELVKDGYMTAPEKINSIQVTDETIEINGKKIKAADEKKYRTLFNKFERAAPGRKE